MTQSNPDPESDPSGPEQAAWAWAQEAYLGGESAAVVAARIGVSERTLQRRAAKDGWRRKDQPRAWLESLSESADRDADDPNSPTAQFAAMATRETSELLIDPTLPVFVRHAFRRSAEAAAMSRVSESLHWARLFVLLQGAYHNAPAPDARANTADRLRAAYAEALRAYWGEGDAPDPLPWRVEPDDTHGGGGGPCGE